MKLSSDTPLFKKKKVQIPLAAALHSFYLFYRIISIRELSKRKFSQSGLGLHYIQYNRIKVY